MSVTATELKKNLGKYLDKARTEDVFISQYGRIIAVLSNPNKTNRALAQSLFGIIPEDFDVEQARIEGIQK